MTTQQIADRLVELCRQGKFGTAQKELYATDAVSTETEESPAFAKETKGLDAIEKKGQVWMEMVQEMHGVNMSDPVVADHSFACSLTMDVTMKEYGRTSSTELCVYQVKEGKIVSEEFFL